MKKLAIVGTHTLTRHLAPYDDPDCDIWVFNESGQANAEFYRYELDKQWCKRWDAIIQIHKPEVYRSQTNWVINSHWDWLQRNHGDKVIWMQGVDPLVPNSKRYPLDEIIAIVPGAKYRWFTSSVSYAAALAIYQGYKDVGFYGLDMESNTEYGYQLPNFIYWIGVMEGLGINLYHVSNKQYFSEKLYGYEGELQIDRNYFADRVTNLRAQWKEKESLSNKLKDRIIDAIVERKVNDIPKLMIDWRATAIEAGRFSGAENEAANYAKREDHISRQEFERRAAQAAKDSDEVKEKMYVLTGNFEYVYNAWVQTGQYQPLEQMRKFLQAAIAMAYELGGKHGAYVENLEYIKEYDDRLQAAGGVRTQIALAREEKHA